MKTMKYSIFFILLFLCCIWLFVSISNNFRYIFIWLGTNMALFACAYTLNNPFLICGKKQDGSINLMISFINLPWLLFGWIIFKIQQSITIENAIDQIIGTNWYISSYPGIYAIDNDYDVVVDLTAEFPRSSNREQNYICYPNLDGIPLVNIISHLNIDSTSKVLVHCAQGHGRSATFSAITLAKLKIFPSVKFAYDAIIKSRPGAIASKYQIIQMNQYE